MDWEYKASIAQIMIGIFGDIADQPFSACFGDAFK